MPLTDKLFALVVSAAIAAAVAGGCVRSNLPRAQQLLRLVRASEHQCKAAPAAVRKQRCRVALSCASPVRRALEDRLAADEAVARGNLVAEADLSAADASEAAALAACDRAGVRVEDASVAVAVVGVDAAAAPDAAATMRTDAGATR